MTTARNVKLTLAVVDPELDEEEKDLEARRLLRNLREMKDEVERVELATREPTAGTKPVLETLVGILTAEVSAKNIKAVFERLSEYWKRPIEMEVEANGRKLKLKVSSQKDLEKAIEAAQKFVAGS
ncbi:MAG: hypothetical protein KME42_13170 [Tildeniella nuda ZEHNDER 1965/U140]|nr:hypothetical protein [Tildeniella nuda ZEHNDER 1965/U140]